MSDYTEELDLELFTRERNEALLSLDREKVEAYVKKYGMPLEFPADEEIYEIGIHKAITGITNLNPEDRKRQLQSVKWLMVRGYSHFMSDITPDELMQIAFENAELPHNNGIVEF